VSERHRRGETECVAQMREVAHRSSTAEDAQTRIDVWNATASGPLHEKTKHSAERHFKGRLTIMRAVPLAYDHIEAFPVQPDEFGNGRSRIGAVGIANCDQVM